MNFSRISAISGEAAYAKFAVIYGLNEKKRFVKDHKRFGCERQFQLVYREQAAQFIVKLRGVRRAFVLTNQLPVPGQLGLAFLLCVQRRLPGVHRPILPLQLPQ